MAISFVPKRAKVPVILYIQIRLGTACLAVQISVSLHPLSLSLTAPHAFQKAQATCVRRLVISLEIQAVTLAYPASESADILECQAAIFEWAESFDTKDWERLSRCVSPTLYVCYEPRSPRHTLAHILNCFVRSTTAP